MMEAIKIIVASILLAVLYGICHDLVTANISVAYFTVGHPKIIESESPIKLALLWGVIATWWVGLILGVVISVAARFGNKPKLTFSNVIQPIMRLLAVMAVGALLAGLIGFILAKLEFVYLVEVLARKIHSDKHHLFLTALWAHAASYLIGILGSLILCVKFWRKRNLTN